MEVAPTKRVYAPKSYPSSTALKINTMKRALFSDPPMIHSWLVSSGITLEARKARRVSGMLQCIARLRPEWEGSVLTRDCFNSIGRVAAEYLHNYRMENAKMLTLHVEFDCAVDFDLTGFQQDQFDSAQYVERGEDNFLYQQFSISFYWWPNLEHSEYERVRTYVMSLIPDRLQQEHVHGVDMYNVTRDEVSFGPEDLDEVDLNTARHIEAVFWLGPKRIMDEDDEDED